MWTIHGVFFKMGRSDYFDRRNWWHFGIGFSFEFSFVSSMCIRRTRLSFISTSHLGSTSVVWLRVHSSIRKTALFGLFKHLVWVYLDSLFNSPQVVAFCHLFIWAQAPDESSSQSIFITPVIHHFKLFCGYFQPSRNRILCERRLSSELRNYRK